MIMNLAITANSSLKVQGLEQKKGSEKVPAPGGLDLAIPQDSLASSNPEVPGYTSTHNSNLENITSVTVSVSTAFGSGAFSLSWTHSSFLDSLIVFRITVPSQVDCLHLP